MKNLIKLISCLTVSVLAFSNMAFAETASQKESDYAVHGGTIEEITPNDDGSITLHLKNDTSDLILTVEKNVFTFSGIDNTVKTVSSLEKGMTIAAVLSSMQPMTMSLPPQTYGAAAIIISPESGFINVSMYNDALVNADNSLALNIEKSTVIVHSNGTKMIFGADDIKNNNAIVLYTASTKSIPAQTTPSAVILLQEQEPANESIPLRAAAEKLGYTVKWESNSKPITVEKEVFVLSLTLDSEMISVNGESVKLSAAPVLSDSVTCVPSELLDYLK